MAAASAALARSGVEPSPMSPMPQRRTRVGAVLVQRALASALEEALGG